MRRPRNQTTDQRLTALEHACRGAVGDRLRSVAVDSPEWSGTVYRRGDLPPGADSGVRETAVADGAACADGGRTVATFEDGYVACFQLGDTQVVATSDGIRMDRRTELSAAVRGLISE